MRKETIFHFLAWTALTSLCYLALLYYFLYSWVDGASGMFQADRMLILPLFPGLLLFVVETVTSTIALYQYRKQALRVNEVPLKWTWLLLLLTAAVFLFSFGLDAAYYSFVDSSISRAYAETMMQVAANQGRAADMQVVNMFAQLPFFAQNIFLNFFAILMGNILSLVVSKNLYKQPRLAM